MPASVMYHEGNRQLQDRFASRRISDRLEEKLTHREFTDDDKRFIEGLPYFFLATADAEGQSDCSFKGGEPGFVRLTGRSELAFPDYDGNGMFKSLGNLLVNPKVALLFLDFEQPNRMRVSGTAQVTVGNKTLPARITFIGPVIAAQTRTASVRLELDNAAGLLKPDMYVDVILQEPAASVIAVPESAVMNTGMRSVVFIARGNGAFEPRQVATGGRANGFYEVRSGVQPGERVVVDANYLVDSESRLKSALSQMR